MSKGGSQTSDTHTRVVLSPERQSLLDLGMKALQKIPNQFGIYPKRTLAEIDPLSKQAQETYLGTIPALQERAGQVQEANKGLLQAADLSKNPYYQTALDAAINPLTSNFLRVTLPSVRSGGVSAGQAGSSRAGVAESLANKDYLQQVGNTSAGFAENAYQQGLNTELQALQLQPVVSKSLMAPGLVQEMVGSQRQAQAQSIINDLVQKYYMRKLYPLQQVSQLFNYVSGLPGGESFGTSTVEGGSSGSGGLMGGGIGTALGMGLGALLAPATGGLSLAAGASLGGMLGGAGGSAIGSAFG